MRSILITIALSSSSNVGQSIGWLVFWLIDRRKADVFSVEAKIDATQGEHSFKKDECTNWYTKPANKGSVCHGANHQDTKGGLSKLLPSVNLASRSSTRRLTGSTAQRLAVIRASQITMRPHSEARSNAETTRWAVARRITGCPSINTRLQLEYSAASLSTRQWSVQVLARCNFLSPKPAKRTGRVLGRKPFLHVRFCSHILFTISLIIIKLTCPLREVFVTVPMRLRLVYNAKYDHCYNWVTKPASEDSKCYGKKNKDTKGGFGLSTLLVILALG